MSKLVERLLRQERIDLSDINHVRAYLENDSVLHYEVADEIIRLQEALKAAEEKLSKRRHWQTAGQSDEWYTPAYIFDALGCTFDLDVAHPEAKTHVPAQQIITANSLEADWFGYVWMNPPFGGRNSLKPWLDKFFDHGHGIALTPDRSSAPWWQEASRKADAVLFIKGKVRFFRPDGSVGKSAGKRDNTVGCWRAGCRSPVTSRPDGAWLSGHASRSSSPPMMRHRNEPC